MDAPVSIAVFRQAQDWLGSQVERELVDLFTLEQIRRDDAGCKRVARHAMRMVEPFVEWVGAEPP